MDISKQSKKYKKHKKGNNEHENALHAMNAARNIPEPCFVDQLLQKESIMP
jgi:hypothetical protein